MATIRRNDPQDQPVAICLDCEQLASEHAVTCWTLRAHTLSVAAQKQADKRAASHGMMTVAGGERISAFTFRLRAEYNATRAAEMAGETV